MTRAGGQLNYHSNLVWEFETYLQGLFGIRKEKKDDDRESR